MRKVFLILVCLFLALQSAHGSTPEECEAQVAAMKPMKTKVYFAKRVLSLGLYNPLKEQEAAHEKCMQEIPPELLVENPNKQGMIYRCKIHPEIENCKNLKKLEKVAGEDASTGETSATETSAAEQKGEE